MKGICYNIMISWSQHESVKVQERFQKFAAKEISLNSDETEEKMEDNDYKCDNHKESNLKCGLHKESLMDQKQLSFVSCEILSPAGKYCHMIKDFII